MLPSVRARIMEVFSRNKVDVTTEEVEDIAIMSIELGAVDVAELFAPTGFTDSALCMNLGLNPGFAINLCECKTIGPNAGEFWDLNKSSDVKKSRDD